MKGDSRQCSRCGRLNETGRAIDPCKTCPHGKPCRPHPKRFGAVDCEDCEAKRQARHAEVTGQVARTLERPNETLAALGGRAVSGVADGPAGVQRRKP